ncbi:aldose reductase-like [Orussus abietinus]|uniref:aldose reductase-like n=1 Tax=Orussus abietinus TaxID=222816 RepID=UPI0006260754|nr:aldose reductase-like [Orussus abietinus]
MAAPLVSLNNGKKIPVLGLGTWQGSDHPSVVEEAIKDAVDAGYRHFDCAMVYGNEKDIGKALCEKIAEGVVKREDLFITTKLWNNAHKPDMVVKTCKQSLENFGLDYIDLYLMHWPFDYTVDAVSIRPLDEKGNPMPGDVDFIDTWKEMEECFRLGLTKSIGLSNFNSQQIDRILGVAKIKPTMNQIECHPYLNQKKLIEFCSKRQIAITAYSPLGSSHRPWIKPNAPKVVIDEPVIKALSEKYKKSPAQIVLRYLIDIGTIVIPKSSSKERIRENINIFDFKLTPEEISKIDKLDRGERICVMKEYSGHRFYPFNIEY